MLLIDYNWFAEGFGQTKILTVCKCCRQCYMDHLIACSSYIWYWWWMERCCRCYWIYSSVLLLFYTVKVFFSVCHVNDMSMYISDLHTLLSNQGLDDLFDKFKEEDVSTWYFDLHPVVWGPMSWFIIPWEFLVKIWHQTFLDSPWTKVSEKFWCHFSVTFLLPWGPIVTMDPSNQRNGL